MSPDDPSFSTDERYHPTDPMWRALWLARQAIGVCEPNPRVGCVITDAQGRVLGEGHTQAAGEAHAEVMALRAARAAGHDLRGATAHVTLEPCSHHGRTPPCCDALIEAGLAGVEVAAADPNPLVDGRGLARLRAAGLAVRFGDETQAEASRELNIGFFSRMRRGRPWVRMKIAASLDGRTALPNGVSQWITDEPARRDGHAWRRRAGATLTGVGTVLEDDPRLDVRLVETRLQPLRVVVDSRLQMPPTARLLAPPGAVLVYAGDGAAAQPVAASPDAAAPGMSGSQASTLETRCAALRARGAEVAVLPNAAGKVDLAAMLADLAARGINELHVEAGHKLNGSFLREGLVDELLLYVAPRLLGDGLGLAAIGTAAVLDDAPAWRFSAADPVGRDLRLRLRRATAGPL